MKPGQERRLRKLENEHTAELEAERIVQVRWLTGDEIKRGVQPGLYDLVSQRSHRETEIVNWGRELKYAEASDTSSGEPFQWQSSFHESTALYKGFSGPVGSGKSRALCYEALSLAYENQGCTGLIGAPTYPMLRDSVLLAFLGMLNDNKVPHRFYKSEDVLLLLEPKARILFRPLDSFERIRGTNLAWFGVDELTYCKLESWLRLEARLRDPQAKRKCGFASWTPKGYDWVWQRFIGPKKTPGYKAFRAQQNPTLGDYYQRLEQSYDARFFHQEALGEYLSVFAGQAYYPFLRSAHIRRVEYKPDYPLWWALDCNINPMCSVIGQTINGNVCVLEELSLPRSNTLAACEEFLARTEKWVQMREVPMPPGYEDMGITLPTPLPLNVYVYGDATSESSCGFKNTAASRTDWQIIREFFGRYADRFHVQIRVPSSNPTQRDRVNCLNAKLRNQAGEHSLFLSPRCEELAIDLEQVNWKSDAAGNVLADLDKSDPLRTHLSDALGYYVAREFPMKRRAGERSGPALL